MILTKEKGKISAKWLIYIVVTVVANAVITIVGKMQVEAFDGNYKNEFYCTLGNVCRFYFLSVFEFRGT